MNLNKFSSFSVILLVLASILGCNNNAGPKESSNQNNVSQSKGENSNSQKDNVNEAIGSDLSNSFDSSIYYASESDPTIKSTDKQVIWKEGEVVLTAEISKAEGLRAAESNTVISAIHIVSSNKDYYLDFDKEPLGIQSVALSQSNQIAVYVRDHEGSRLFILDLLNGEQIVLNNFDFTFKVAPQEKIDSYNWSPDGNKLALSIGQIGSSYIALYDTESNTFSEISNKDFRLITAVVWHKDGQGFDFLSKPDDALNSSILYRYTEKDHLIIKKIDNLTENEQITLAKFLPIKIE